MTHAQLVQKAVEWLRAYRCGVVLSEQACISGEMPDAIGWKRSCHSVLVECKISRADFLADRGKDRKSTRLNSSHSQISYAVFCLKKKKHISFVVDTLNCALLLCYS